MDKQSYEPAKRDDAKAELRKILPVGSKVYYVNVNVRHPLAAIFRVYAVVDYAIHNITQKVCVVLGYQLVGAVRVMGGGFDHASEISYDLARALYGSSYTDAIWPHLGTPTQDRLEVFHTEVL